MRKNVVWTPVAALLALTLAGCPTPPSGTAGPVGAVAINFDDAYTVTPRVTLGLVAVDAEGDGGASTLRMMISNAPDFLGSDWEAYSATRVWDLAAGDGEKTVFAKFADAAGSESEVYSDSILLDSTLPAPPPSPDLAAEDDSGVSDSDDLTNRPTALTFSGSGVEPGAAVRLYTHLTGLVGATDADSSGTWTVDVDLSEGLSVVFARVLDAAGNESPSSTGLAVTVDLTPPGVPAIVVPAQGANTATVRRPSFRWREAADASSYELEADRAPSFASPNYDWTGLRGTSFTPASDLAVSGAAPVGTRYYLRLRAVDAAGNAGEWSHGETLRYVNVGRFDRDFNGDGYSDIIAGAVSYGKFRGRAYIYFGGAAVDGVPDVTMTGEAVNDSFGSRVAWAGDLNGDGYADAIVAARDPRGNPGKVYVYLGGPAMDNVADLLLSVGPADPDFGSSVASAGDVNADGYADFVVGDPSHNGARGRALIYFGASTLDAGADVALEGDARGGAFGSSVASAGDVNADGYADLVVGAIAHNNYQGHAFVYFGGPSMDGVPEVTMTGGAQGDGLGASVASAGDVNADGYADLVVGATWLGDRPGRAFVYLGGPAMDGLAEATFTGETLGDRFGWSVAPAGDVDGDGYADAMVGASAYADAAGRAYIFLGGPQPNGTPDFVVDGQAAGESFGTSVGSAGDMNADGFSDAVVGAPDADRYNGRLYLYFGGSFVDNSGGLTIYGELSGGLGWSL